MKYQWHKAATGWRDIRLPAYVPWSVPFKPTNTIVDAYVFNGVVRVEHWREELAKRMF